MNNIYLSYNQFTMIPANIFQGNFVADTIDFSNNEIHTIEPRAFDGANVSVLILDSNKLTKITKDMFYGLKAEMVDFSFNQVSMVEDFAFRDSSITAVSFAVNSLSGGLTGLTGLNGLVSLNLMTNGITSLNRYGFMEFASSLKDLNLEYNQISLADSPLVFSGLTLESLTLSNNQITSLPQNSFAGLSCGSLYLDSNNLSSLEPGAFATSIVKTLSLDSNVIHHMNYGSLADLNDLQTLIITNNSLQTLDGTVFDDTPSLKALILKNNNLHTIPVKSFMELSVLDSLDLSYNDISTLSDCIFPNQVIQNVFISGNSLTCLPANLHWENIDDKLPICEQESS